MHHKSFDHSVGTFEIGGAAGREIFVVFLAADWRHSDMQARNIHQFHALDAA